MKSPLVSKKCGSRTKHAGSFLHAALLVLALLHTTAAQEHQSNEMSVYYPHSLVQQIQRIVQSSTDEVQPLREICTAILDDIDSIVSHVEHNPAEPCLALQRLEELSQALDTLQTLWTATPSDSLDAAEYTPSAVALEELTLALKRRIFIWKSLFQSESAKSTPLLNLYGKSFDDINRLRERTLAVEQYFLRSRRVIDRQTGQTWGDYFGTQSWISELEAYQHLQSQPIRHVSLSVPFLPTEVLKTLAHRANSTVLRLESTPLTDEQRAFLNHPVVNAWKEELQSWTADIVAPVHALRLLEQYETSGGISDMKAFSLLIEQLDNSKTAEYRKFGDDLRRQYGMANVRLFISSALLNNHLPPPVSKTASFRDVIQSQQIVGRRQADTVYKVSFIPHPTRILMSLDVDVDLATFARTDAFATQLFNTGRTLVEARKAIELTEKGFLTDPSEAMIVEHRMRLVGMNTEFDGLPLLSGMVRNTVRGQYESRFQSANMETRYKILRQVRAEVDRETEKRLQPVSKQILELSQYANDEFGLIINKRESRTDENWLVTSWGIRRQDSLTGNTLAPATLPGSFADLKIHESLPNLLMGSLEFEGKRGTVGEFKKMLAERFRQPALADPAENDDVEVTFAAHNPIAVRFVDGRIELTISIAALRLLRQTHRDFQVIVRYKSAYDAQGRQILERDGYISLVNINVREQVVLRAVFGKIFPVSRPFPLIPKVLEEDSQFNYLTTGHCRIEKGWFALALVEK